MRIVCFLLLAQFVISCTAAPEHERRPRVALGADEVRIDVDAGRAVRTMRGGVGACWSAIEKPIPGVNGGSAWGAKPPADDEAAWKEIYRHADWLGFDFVRVELSQRMYEPERNRFDWDNPEMRILYRILDWCESRKADVLLQQLWANVEWNTFRGWRGHPANQVHSGPVSMEDFAEGLATLVEHLVRKKGYTCIRTVSITNEPGHFWSWWNKPPDSTESQPDGEVPLRPNEQMSLTAGLAAARKALDKRGLKVPLCGPDWTRLPLLEPHKIDFDHLLGVYDLHFHYAQFDGMPKGCPMSVVEARLRDWADFAHAGGKPFYLTETGTMAYGHLKDHPGPGTYEAALVCAECMIVGVNAGVDAFSRWSFLNRGDVDGQWQMLETWDREKNALREKFTPMPNVYHVYGLLSRFTAKNSAVLGCRVRGGTLENEQWRTNVRHVHAAALRSSGGHLTLAVVNDAEKEWDLTAALNGLERETKLHRYRVTPAQRDRADLQIEPEREVVLSPGAAEFSDQLPARSVTVYSTFRLSHRDAGIMTVEPGR